MHRFHRRPQGLLQCVFWVLFLVLSVRSIAGEPLRYSIAPGQVVYYEVKLSVETPSSIDTMTGVIQYKGQKDEGDDLTVLYQGGLKKASRTKRNAVDASASTGGKRLRGLNQTKSVLIIRKNGLVRGMEGDSQLPTMLGNLSMLPFQQFPEDDRKQWTIDSGILLISELQSEDGASLVNEHATYEIVSEDGNLISITRAYELNVPAATDGLTHNITGNGTFVFNRKLGLSERFDSKQTLAASRDNVTINFPMTIHWHRMTQDEVAAYKKRLADEEAARVKELTKYERPIDPEDKQKSMAKLRSDDWQVAYRLLRDMRRSIRKELAKQDVDVAVQIGMLRAHENENVREAADVIWKKWGAAVEKHGSAEDRANVSAAVAKRSEIDKMAASEKSPAPDTPPKKGEVHRWTDRRGVLVLEGQFVRLDRAHVIVRAGDGKEVRILKPRLSKEDQALVERLAK